MAKKKPEKPEGSPNKEKSKMSNKPLQIHGIAIRRTTPATEHGAAQAGLELSVDVENPNDQPLHVWASCKEYDYNPTTHVLSVDLAEPTREIPPYIIMISDHPRTPAQVMVDAKRRATIKVLIPGKINRPGSEGGPAWAEEPIGPIDRVEIRIQHGAEPIQHRSGENPADFRQRLQEHGDVVQAEITPTETEKEK